MRSYTQVHLDNTTVIEVRNYPDVVVVELRQRGFAGDLSIYIRPEFMSVLGEFMLALKKAQAARLEAADAAGA